ncbi:MAG: amidohydrolase [Thermovirgaceae bacterium]|nr:amidohydrolase [Thermovirgaceae bacterium]
MKERARLYSNCRVKTMNPLVLQAEAFLVYGEMIEAVGKNEEVRRHSLAGEAEKIDLEGRRVIPGIIDSHLHFSAWSESKRAVDLSECRSIPEVVEKLSERVSTLPPDAWVRGMHFDHSRFAENRLPDRSDLDAVKNPVLLTRVCYHAHCANSRALEMAGIPGMKDLPGGIQRDGAGNPTGVVLESGANMLFDAFRKGSAGGDDPLEGLSGCMREMASYGVTSINTTSAKHLGIDESFGPYQELERRGELLQRVTIHFNDLLPFGISSFLGSDSIRLGGLKLFADGGFCARTAAMSFDYKGMPGYRGDLNYDPAAFSAIVLEAQAQGVQVAVHAIGDRAIDMVLDAFEAAIASHPRLWLRHRIIHCYIVRPEQAKRMASLRVIGDIQPVFLADEIDIAEAGIPEEVLPISYAWRSLQESGVLIAGSSDCPAALPNPWLGIDAAVNRVRSKERTPVGGWFPEQKLTLDETIALFTRNPAVSLGMGDMTGTIEAGKFADFVVLEDDPWSMPAEDLSKTRVAATFRGGECIFGKI